MRHSIHGAWHGILDIPAITNGDFGLGPQERQIWGMPLFEPKPEIPSMEDSSLPMFGGICQQQVSRILLNTSWLSGCVTGLLVQSSSDFFMCGKQRKHDQVLSYEAHHG